MLFDIQCRCPNGNSFKNIFNIIHWHIDSANVKTTMSVQRRLRIRLHLRSTLVQNRSSNLALLFIWRNITPWYERSVKWSMYLIDLNNIFQTVAMLVLHLYPVRNIIPYIKNILNCTATYEFKRFKLKCE